MSNRLANETSPYLLQHADNPVDWYPWGPEALERAKREDKPILLSVGYSACHWCHVMAHESFEDDETARLMNELYVNIKVDREERPDLDSYFRTQGDEIRRRGAGLIDALGQVDTHSGDDFGALTHTPLLNARTRLEQSFDEVHGGFGDAPKFPHPSNLDLLLAHWHASLGKEADEHG